MDLIIGAGISGISYANFTNSGYILIEKSSGVGGYCKTIKRNGFVWDYSGHFFHFRYPEIEKMVCRNIAGNSLLKVEKHTQILYNNQYIDFPFQKNIHQLGKEEFIDCLYDLFANNGNVNPQTFKEMVCANYGQSIADKFLIPYNEKLYACDLNSLDIEAMGRFFPKASKEEIILNFRSRNNSSYNAHFTYSRGGAIEYVDSLRRNIDEDKIALNEELEYIDVRKKTARTNKRTISYDRLISTVPFPELLNFCRLPYPENQFSWNKVLVFNLGFDCKGRDKINSWIYVPNREFLFYRVGYYDNIMQTDRMSLYVEIGFPENYPLSDSGFYLNRVLSDLKKCGIITSERLIDYEAILMNPAYVHINKKGIDAVERYKKKLSDNGIYSIGRYGSWTYCSIEDNILEARDLANRLDTESGRLLKKV